MRRRYGERAVTVQIGAILLLAIVFTALALYQVNAVPAENQAVEIDHNRQIHGEMQELRNAIKNTGTTGGSTSISVTLGTQYPTRTFLTNPPDPTGTLETTDPSPLTINNADVTAPLGGYSERELEDRLLGSHETRTVVYRPHYNEYRDAPATRIEHGLAFNDFGDATVELTDQPLIDGDRVTIVLVDGDLSTSSSSATTVDSRSLSGPTDPVSLESTDDNITITVPTQSPDVWNETIGTDFGPESGQENARVVPSGYADGKLPIELAKRGEPYDLQMACVAIGDSDTTCEDFDIDGEADSRDGTTLAGPNVTDLELDPVTVTRGETVDIAGKFDNRGTATDLRGGTPIVDAEWYLVENDRNGFLSSEEFSRETTLWANGTIDTETLETNTTYTVGVRAQDTRGVWTNESVDGRVMEFTVEDEDSAEQRGLEYAGTARTSEGSQSGTDSRVAFDLVNTGTDSVTVEGVTVEKTGPADKIRSDDVGFTVPEVFVQSTDNGFAWQFGSGGYRLGDRIDLDDTATVEEDQEVSVILTEFQQQRNTNTAIDMTGRSITATVDYRYDDGTTDEVTITFTPPEGT
ncbi:hypothetical protein DVR14_21545 (plasmid) [Natrinema thermotolerans]|nr:hypothetical protein DVR14_17415 [Natrinema thermotolerans]QCC61223.1 hypothetical protein DVR14_21545 [Natrinema thermotolerans]